MKKIVFLVEGQSEEISGARAISPLLDLNHNRSHSFNVFLKGIRHFAAY